jgi:DNA polymerase-1
MPKSFYIIDGHAQIFRAYFAPFRDLTSPTGEPTKATYVFTQMLINLIAQRQPDYLAMVIDSGDEHVFRKQIYPEYKANRTPIPDDFFPQEQRILQIVKDAGVPIFARHGFEADDLIATMARRLCGKGFQVYLVSKDKDLRQLLDECTFMYDVQADEVIDARKLEEKVGYAPHEAIEVQSLMGDTVDNVPGIPGVGEKTAARLIRKYGKADVILQHLDELTPKLRENVEKYGDKIGLARQLVTLKNDVEFEFDPAACEFRGLNAVALRQHLQSLGFHSLLARVEKGVAEINSARPTLIPQRFSESLFEENAAAADDANLETHAGCNYCLVETESKFVELLANLKRQKKFAFDTETDALGAMQSNLCGMSFSWEKGTGFYVPVRGPAGSHHLTLERVVKDLKPILEDVSIRKVGHNLKYDLTVMRQLGVNVRGVALDTIVAAFVLDASQMQYGIDKMARQLLNFKKIATDELIGKGKLQRSMEKIELDRVATYASEDADIAFRLAEVLGRKLDETPALRKLCDQVETPLIEVLVEMESNGIAIDPAVLKEQSQAMAGKIEELREQIFKKAGNEFNPDSPKQLADVLFDRLGLKIVKRTKTGPSTDIEVLERLADKHAVPKLILEYRSLVKLKNTYLDNLPEFVNPKTKRIHASFSQIGAATGRLSCSDPNLQNIPIRTDEGRRIRSAFVPGDPEHNVLLTADYSQIELRFLAHFTEEPALVEAFARDEDIHRTVAAEVFNAKPENVTREQRGQAKIVNFGIVYGVTASGLARRIEGMTVRSASELINAYHKRFPRIKQFLEQCVVEAQTKGYVETLCGRRRPVTDIHSQVVALRNAAERIAINSVVQGSAADLIKIAMRNVFDRLRKEKRPSKMLLQVHDELVFETPANVVEDEARVIREEMTSAMKLEVPLKVEVGWAKNWQEVK